jgi:hypothetical protein
VYTGSCAKCFRILWLLGSLGDFVAQNKVIGSVNRSSVLKHVLHGILLAAHPILWCLVLLLLSTTLFAIVGVRLAGGKLDSCTDLYLAYPAGIMECSGVYMTRTGVLFPRAWRDNPLTLNDLPQALVTLLVVSTMRWAEVSDSLMDATMQHIQSVRLYRPEMTVFLFAFIMVVSFMLGNLSTAYVVNAIRDTQSPDNRQNRRYILFKQRIVRWTPTPVIPPAEGKRTHFARIMLSTPGCKELFELLNVVAAFIMLLEHTDMPAYFHVMIDVSRGVFGFMLFLELFLHSMAYGPMWLLVQPSHLANIVSLVAVIAWAIGLAVHNLSTETVSSRQPWKQSLEFKLAVLVCEKARLLRFLFWLSSYSQTHWVHMRVIMLTLRLCIWRFLSFMVVSVVILLLLAVIGYQLFSHVRQGEKLGHMTSLGSVRASMLALVFIFLGDEWHILLRDCSISFPDCTPSFAGNGVSVADMGVGDCGAPMLALVYFVLVKFLFTNVLFGSLIWAILESFQEACDVEDGRIQNSDMKALSDEWSNTPSTMHGHLLLSQVADFLQQLPPPLCLVGNDQVEKSGRPFAKHPTIMRFVIEVSILAWCRKTQRQKKKDVIQVPMCPDTRYPDIREISLFDIRSHKQVEYFDLALSLMHTVTPEVQSAQLLVLRRPILVVVEKVMAAIYISAWYRRCKLFRDGWNKLLDMVHQSLLHKREQEAAEKAELQRQQEQAEAEEARRRKRMMDEIYNIEAWVLKTCPLWEKEEKARQRREEEEEARRKEEEEKAEMQERGLNANFWARISSDATVASVESVQVDSAQAGFQQTLEEKAAPSLLQRFKAKVNMLKVVSKLSKGDARTDSYFARCIYYQINIPYGTQYGTPLAPSTCEHIEGHPYWKESNSSFRTIAVSLFSHSNAPCILQVKIIFCCKVNDLTLSSSFRSQCRLTNTP